MDRQSEPPRRPPPAVPLPPVRHTASPAPGIGEDSQRLPRFWKTTPVSNLPGNDALLQRLMGENGVRLVEKWKSIATRYGSVPVEEDDVIDIMKGIIVVDRGRISASEPRPFLEGPEFDADDNIEIDPFVERMGPDVVKFGAHEDELGGWGMRSGLDRQTPSVNLVEVPKTAQDFADIAEFERMEAEERQRREERGIDLRKEVEPTAYSLTDMEGLSIEDAEGDDPLAAALDDDDGNDPLAAALDEEDDDEDSSVSILQNRDEQTPLSISQLMPATYASLTATVQASGSRSRSREPTTSASRSAPRQPSSSRSRASTGESSRGPRASSSSARHSLPLDSTPPSSSRPPSTPHPVARMRSTSTARPADLPRELSTSRSLPNLRSILRKPSDGTTPRRRATQNAAATAPRVRFHEDYMTAPVTRHPLQQRKGKGRMAGERPNDRRSEPPVADDSYDDDWNGHAEGRSNVVPRSRSTESRSSAAHDSSSDESSHSPTFTQQRFYQQSLGRPSSNSMPPLRRASVGAGRADSLPPRRRSSTSQRLSTRRPTYLDSIQEDNFGNVMECTLCLEDGGRRAELAKFCRGRTPSSECAFEPSSPQRPSSPIQQASSSPFASPSASPSPRRRSLSSEFTLHRTSSYSPELRDVSPQPLPAASTPRPRAPRPSSEAPFRPPRTASQTPVVPDDAARPSLRTQEFEASTTQSLPDTNDRLRAVFPEAKDHCESCIAAGGERAEKEGYCPGRVHPQLCVGRQPAQPRPRAASEAQSHFTTRGQDPHEDDADDESEVQFPRPPRNEPIRNTARPQTPHPRSAATPTPSSATSNRSYSSGNSGSTLRSSTPGKGGGVAHCRACRQAGGVREQQSHECRGRTRPHLCLFYRENDDGPPRVCTTTPIAPHCRACRRAGGTREEQSHKCRGKSRPHLCSFYQEGTEETPIPVRASTVDATRASVSPAATLVSTFIMVAPPDRSPSAVPSELPQVTTGAESGSISTEQHASDDESEDFGGYASEEHAAYTGDLPEDNGHEAENATESTSDEDMDEVDDSFDSDLSRPQILSSSSESDEASAYEESDSSEEETESAEEDTDDSDASWTGNVRRRSRQRQQKSTARPATLDGGEQYYVDLDDKAVANYAPPPDDRTLYHPHLAMDHSVGGFKVCDKCIKARGDRAERAMWCRGRDGKCRVGVQGAKSAQASRATTAPPSSRNLRSHSRSQRFQRPSQADMLRESMPDIFSPEPVERTVETAAGGPSNSQLSSEDEDADAGESMDVDDFEVPVDAETLEAAHTTNDSWDSAVDEDERQACANRKRVVYTPVRSPRPSPAVQMGGTASPVNAVQSLPRAPAPDNWAYRPPRALTVHPTPPPPSYRPPRALSILPTPPRSSSVVTTSSPPPPLRALTAPVASRLTPPPSSTGSSTPRPTRLSAHKRNFGIPRNPPHAPSSDPLEGLASDPPEAQSVRSSSPIGSYSADIVTRARDAGFALPPVPTGRLPSHLINAHQRSPPAGQPLAAALSSPAFALPTPPPSSSSPLRRATSSAPRPSVPGQGSSSRTARASMVLSAKERVPAQSRTSSNSSPGLMLPPPVPHRPAASPRKRPAFPDESDEATRPPPSPSPRKVRARTAADAELSSSPEERESVLSTYGPPSPSPRKRRARTAVPSGIEGVGEKPSSSRSAPARTTTNTRRRSDTVSHIPEHESEVGPTTISTSTRRARSVATPRPDKTRSSTRASLPATTASRPASETRPKRTSARRRHESVPAPVVHDSDEEWGLDEDAGEVGRIWREATAYTYV